MYIELTSTLFIGLDSISSVLLMRIGRSHYIHRFVIYSAYIFVRIALIFDDQALFEAKLNFLKVILNEITSIKNPS